MKAIVLLTIGCLLYDPANAKNEVEQYMTFPPNFSIGMASASYQIEGAWNYSDKGVNVWDWFTHEKPWAIYDRSNGDVACDSYNKYKEDVASLKDLGVDIYRISLSWSRILPNGFANVISKDGIRYYKNLLDELGSAGIEPIVTMYHWDHPQNLEELGGWTNELMVTWFTEYATVVFNELGDRVKLWTTINEPYVVCNDGYGSGVKAPGKKIPAIAPYLCAHNMLKAHAKTYHIYKNDFHRIQKGKIGIVLPCSGQFSKYDNDTETAEIAFQFDCGWLGHPIFSNEGDYPAIMKERIAENSKLEGYSKSRLPVLTQDEIDYVRGTADFFGLNHYTSAIVEPVPKQMNKTWYNDRGYSSSVNSSWPHSASSWLNVVPEGLGYILRKLKDEYNNPLVYVLENGISDNGTSLDDVQRIDYYHGYLRELLLAVNRDGCNVKGYTAWTFLDNFEWERGYSERFGFVHVDFTSPNRTRVPKLSYRWFQELLKTRKLPPSRENSIDYSVQFSG